MMGVSKGIVQLDHGEALMFALRNYVQNNESYVNYLKAELVKKDREIALLKKRLEVVQNRLEDE